MDDLSPLRKLMKSEFGRADCRVTDQQRGVPPPPVQKPPPSGAPPLALPAPNKHVLKHPDLDTCLRQRCSRRRFRDVPVSLEQLAYLLWACQGVKEVVDDGRCTIRTVPSAGARHPYETYLAVNRVATLEPGLYRYLAVGHQLVHEAAIPGLAGKLTVACLGQRYVGGSAVVFIWSCIPYRCEWRYHILGHRVMLMDAGHLCQNLYLAAEALGLGTCAIGAYDQAAMDALLGLDGQDEYVVYLAPVGVPAAE